MHVSLRAEILRIDVGRRRVDYLCWFPVWTFESVNAKVRYFANGELMNIALVGDLNRGAALFQGAECVAQQHG